MLFQVTIKICSHWVVIEWILIEAIILCSFFLCVLTGFGDPCDKLSKTDVTLRFF